MKITSTLKQHCINKGWTDAGSTDAAVKMEIGRRLKSGELSHTDYAALQAGGKASADVSQKNLGGVVGKAGHIRVKKVSEQYRQDRVIGKHFRTGEPVVYMGREKELPTEAQYAMAGAIMRQKFLRAGLPIKGLSEHERDLIAEAAYESEWVQDQRDDFMYVKGGPQVKALLDDSTSGGQELVPIWFDDMIVTFPLLHGELMPHVTIREVPRSSRIEGGSLGNPTVSWGSTEGTAFTLFDTAALAAAIDTTIYPVVIGVEQGVDFLSDSPVAVGQMLMQNIGESATKEMDNVIANGNGTDRPQGIANASGGTTVASINGSGGPPMLEDAENMAFSIGKQYRMPTQSPAFVMNDTTYKRFRQIPDGVNTRRVLGMDHQAYNILEYPVRIQNDIPNYKAFFACLKQYRLYRRKGFDLRTVTEGQTLALKNTVLIVGRGRFGGKIMDGNALAKMLNLQS